MEKCAMESCQNTVDTAGDYCEKCRTFSICGWYTPSGETQLGNKCVVEGCNRDAAFHLCKQHAVPGMVVKGWGKPVVSSVWLIERAGQILLIVLNHWLLGTMYGGQQGFEEQLRVQGYKVHRLISSEEELNATKQRYPGLQAMCWSLNLTDDQDRLLGGTMISRFSAKQVGSQSPMEVQLQAEGWRTVTFHGWHIPIDDTHAKNKCVVSGCGRISSFHLCKIHAIPGLLGKVSGKNLVFGLWLVERAGQMLIIALSDIALGVSFGGRQGFEQQLSGQGYKVLRLISSEDEFISQQQRPAMRIIAWTHNLPEGEADLPCLK
jgi:hypothetical protein